MTMTRKHFEELARIFCEHSAPYEVGESTANMCREQNPRFDTERFIRACGYGDMEGKHEFQKYKKKSKEIKKS